MLKFLVITKLIFLFSLEVSASSAKVSIMTFNTGNLFDNEHDDGKNDFTFLPLEMKKNPQHAELCKRMKKKAWKDECLKLDWNLHNYSRKLENVAAVIKSAKCPNLVLLQEVENINVLNKLNKDYLKECNYSNAILIEGNDYRGIDNAILSNLVQLGEPQLHMDTRRGILDSAFYLPGGKEKIRVFSIHYPSPSFSDKKADSLRREMQLYLNSIVSEYQKKEPGFVYVAGGDFNTPEDQNSTKEIIETIIPSMWINSHLQACKNCDNIGTIYYPPKKKWSIFDMLLVSKNSAKLSGAKTNWSLDINSTRIVNDLDIQKTPKGTPMDFDAISGKGVSDHWPMYIEIKER
jgi:hypothetical protein